MFNNYSSLETYMYLECFFASLTFGLLIAKIGIEPIKTVLEIIIKEVMRSVR